MPVTTTITPDDLPLQRAYRWERERAGQIFLTQPLGGGEVRDWTWAQAMDEARRVAAWLQMQDYEPGSRIAIMSKNTAWWVMADLAIWMAGHVSVPIYPNLVADSVRPILEHSGSKLVFVGQLDDWASMVGGIPAGVKTVGTPLNGAPVEVSWDAIVAGTKPPKGTPVFPAEATATIIYTSGTTGMPKGAVHGFDSFAHTAIALQRVLNSMADDRVLSYLPLAHVAERCLIEGQSLYLGNRMFFAESLDTFLADLQRARPTVFFSVPRLWVKFQQGVLAKLPDHKLRLLLRLPVISGLVKRKILRQLGLDSVRYAGTGEAPLPPEVTAWYRNLGLDLLEGYGMTEQFAFAAVSLPGRARVGAVGHPTPCCEIRLSPEGEVQSRGPAHMKAYFREPGLTADAFTADGWLRTGDRGAFDAEGRLSIVGRVKEQSKTSKGKYVAPAPIEVKLGAFVRIE